LQRSVGNQAIAAKSKNSGGEYGYVWSSPEPGPIRSDLGEYKPPPRKLTLKELAAEMDETGEKKSVESESGFGIFISVALEVTVPMEIPGLTVAFKIEGEWSKSGKEKELELQLDIKAAFLWFEAKEFQYVKLEGEDLTDAFVDAAKQIIHYALKKAGADAWLQALATSKALRMRMIEYNPSLAPLILWAPSLWETYKNRLANDPSVGFEAAIGLGVGMTDKKDDEIAVETLAGLKDVGRTNTVGFTETATSVKTKVGKSSFDLRLSRRVTDGTLHEKTMAIKAEMEDADADPAAVTRSIKGLLRAGAIGRALLRHDFEDVKEALAVAFPLRGGEDNFGLEMSFTKNLDGKQSPWTCKVRIKEFQSFESKWEASKSVGGLKFTPTTAEEIAKLKPKSVGISADVKYGTFLDISTEIQDLLNGLEAKADVQKGAPAKVVRR
jgi:hypothetical protein